MQQTMNVEQRRLEERIRRRFRDALVRYGLTEDGNRILVGLSGGKDSLCLLELLAEQSGNIK